MKILCENNKEVRIALAQLEKQGYKWASGHKPTELYQSKDKMIIVFDENKVNYAITFCESNRGAMRASQLYSNLLRGA